MWNVVYTKPRAEKKVHQRFLDNGFESYCPTQIVEKQWTDRLKKVELPLFTSYVFVKTTIEKIAEVRYINGVVNFVYWLGKPAQISEKTFEELKFFLESNSKSTINIAAIQENDKIVIKTGAFKDNIGVVKKVLKSKTILLIENLGIQITVSTKNKI
jgi:transcription antitermination factor NusG